MTIAIDAALSGLRVAQQALDISATNIANASTDGYTRKILPQSTVAISGQGVGVAVGTAFRRVDQGLLTAAQNQKSIVGELNIRNKYMQRIMDFHGPSDSGMAISSLLGTLATSFTQLSSSPDNNNLLNTVVSNAQETAFKFNSFSKLSSDLRMQTERDIGAAVNTINESLNKIAILNQQAEKMANSGRSIADIEDKIDIAIKEISQYIDVTTYKTGGTLVVMTTEGEKLADVNAFPLFFTENNISSSKYYPGGGLSGLLAGSATGKDITGTRLGGELKTLFDLRDNILPKYEAQLDELAQKLSYRFQQAGLKLFTDSSGNVPSNVASPGIPGYIGFARDITVNPAVILDINLLRNGTNGNIEPSGSNEVIRRVAEFTFGAYELQQAQGSTDISAGAVTSILGITTNNRLTGNTNIAAYSDFSTLPNAASLPGNLNMTLTGLGTQIINILPNDNANTLVTKINVAFGTNVASINSLGQLAFNNNGSISLSNVSLGSPVLADLGHSFGVTLTPDPSFQVRVGKKNAVTINIANTDTSVQLLNKLNAISGLSASLDTSGFLVLTPTDGGDISIVDITGTPLKAMGMIVNNIAHVPLRKDNLGASGTLSTGLIGNSTLTNYASSLVSSQAEEHRLTESRLNQEDTFLRTLEKRNSDVSGVNIDQEMANLIRIQSSYAAAAKMLSKANELFDTLIRSI